MTNRQYISKQHTQFYPDGTIDKLIDNLVEIKEAYGETAFIDSDYDYDDRLCYYVYTRVEETDEQYKLRLKLEADKVNYRKMLYEQLKKEFGNE